jgi:FkbM family methyltransferase
MLQKKNARLAGTVSREEYWLEIQKELRLIKSLTEVFSPNLKSLVVSQNGIILKYEVVDSIIIELELDSEDIRSAPFTILSEGYYELFESRILLNIAKDAKLFFDIGANVGFYSIAASVINQNLEIMCFEPNSNCFRQLQRNMEINANNISMQQITVYNIALGESEESGMKFFVPRFTGTGGGSFKNLHAEEGTATEIIVDTSTLDAFASSPFSIDLIKVDVEGSELSVIKGGLETIQRDRPTIFIELLRKWMAPFGHHPQDVLDLLFIEGYECYGIGKNSLRKIELIDEDTEETNYIFCHPNRKSHMKSVRENIL